jgi:hypothetical protein
MRRYDVDYLRVIVFGALIFYHAGMFFVPWGWHIKNAVIYDKLIFPMQFVNQWRIPLLFIISGTGTYYALSKRNGKQFTGERLKRLLLPLIIGILIVVPPQVYLERLNDGQFTGSYFEFYPAHAFTGVYPEGNFSWHHLWFLPYLLLFSLVFAPAFLYLRKHPATAFLRFLGKAVIRKFGLFVFILPLFVWELLLAPYYPSTHALFGDWYNLCHYATLFFSGFLLVSLKDAFWETVKKDRLLYLFTGLTAFSLLLLLWYRVDTFPGKDVLQAFVKVCNLWSWCLAAMGYAATCLNKESKGLKYANEAVYPFYILHQTVLVALGFYLKNLDWGFFPKFTAMAIGTFGISWLIYEFGIRRYRFIRPLFGLKNQRNAVSKNEQLNFNNIRVIRG